MKKSPLPMKNPTNSGKGSVGKDELEKLLKRHFGHSHFRGKQLEAIQAVLSGRDCFCLMPTGGGKSMCYQIPALAKPGIVLVVSPLIALMENQVATLKENGIPAEFLSSTQVSRVKDKIYEDLDSGNPLVKLLYVTPELIATPGFKSKLSKLHSRGLLSLVAIDEAHCISSWGHDFRPSYRKLSSLRSHFPDVPLLALTATAAPKVQDDVIGTLCLRYPLVLRASFNRPTIFYEDLIDDPYLDVSKLIKSNDSACSIIYCLERTTCDMLSGYLLRNGISCAAYHAGLNNRDRSTVLEDWVSSKIQVVVATVAFGMGIDRKDVRLVCHFNIPKSMEAFYQESGRAGRDQMPSRSLIYYGLDDRKRMEFILCNTGSKKGQPSSSTEELSRKALRDFALMVEYCEGSTCRRKKILESFGEQVSISLCQKTCDTCRFPKKVAASLEDLIRFQSQKNSFSKIFIKRSLEVAQEEQKTEFWKREDGDGDASVDEEISDSDDETEVVNSLSRSKMSLKSRTNEKIDILQRAEEIYYQNKGSNKLVGPVTDKKIIHETLREASKQRLLDALKKANERLGDLTIEFETVASFLEMDCYRKFCKAGKTFYNSQVANTVRWLSSSSSSEIKDRVSSCSAPPTTCSLNNKLAQAEDTTGRSQSSDHEGCSLQHIVDEEDTKGGSHGSALPTSTRQYLNKIGVLLRNELPQVPSFSEFVDKKRQGGQSKDSKDLLDSGSELINSQRVWRETAEKQRRLY